MTHVFILGAGFSKAVGNAMPTLVELREDVLERLDSAPDLEPFGNDLEQWLSYLGADQPWLTDADNLRNRALFSDVAQIIHDVVAEKETAVREKEPVEWLAPLASRWAADQATIITFNYDLLVERALMAQHAVSTLADLYAIPLSTRWPAGTSAFVSAGPPLGPVPRLMKLHGSLNWRYSGINAPITDELYLADSQASWQLPGETAVATSLRDEMLFSHKVPLIVPPTGSKSSWYANQALRTQWIMAAKAIWNAESLTVIGYSFPPTDLLVRHMVGQHWTPGRPAVVVDYSPRPVEAVQQLLRQPAVEQYTTADNAVADFVKAYCS
ncbi:SIR2 family protein [Catellatospora chokoriensis]|uniref:SIR2-like domain-containing protein n=1 Tax=Catellatospora chokoriensis TaxID=310353 RepID=A0A8J3K5G8_9ACTN|nr:SIR2 family protein [Catellatospora chokoriensis]GIF93082.1 hypothetical protein Cch02nite_65260 [Catellatospora chokoriensis]